MIRTYSLKGLLLAHDLAFLLLIVVTGVAGWAGVILRQEAADESLRLNTLMALVQEARGDVYRQMTEVFDHHFLGEPHAVTEYLFVGQRIQRTFLRLDETTYVPAERSAIEELKVAYQLVRDRTDEIMSVPSRMPLQTDPLPGSIAADLQMTWLADYEQVFNAADGLLKVTQAAEQVRVSSLSRTTAIVLAIPIALATVLLLVSRASLQRAFVRPVGALLEGVAAYSKGRLDHKVPEGGSAELVTLERAVNRMAKDLAESRAAQVEAERQAALGALIPVVAHNIRNPLASIRAVAQVHEGAGTPQEVVQGLRDIRSTVDRLERWLGALLSYLNPRSLARSDVRIAEVIDQAVTLLAPRLEGKRIRLRRVGWEAPVHVSVDVHLMEQAVYGLLVNAVDASDNDAPLLLTVRRAGDAVQIAISDRGAGMPFRPAPDDLNPGPTTKSYGSGLGIPFAFKICGLHHGMLEFSAREGGGTEVVVTIPCTDSARTAA